MKSITRNFAVLLCLLFAQTAIAQNPIRTDVLLNNNWFSVADEKNNNAFSGFQNTSYSVVNWKKVNVPHNWDQYEGYQRKLHGNKHGFSWYRKTFISDFPKAQKRFFLYFEGVGSYATVWLNGKKVGYHAGGRTTFTLDVTDAIKLNNQTNVLAVRADHPAYIKDLPWVDGGCSTERGFSEGSQPMGIFRPVHLIVTNNLRIEPFGVHVWNDDKISEKSAVLNIETTLKNYSSNAKNITVVNQLLTKEGNKINEVKYNQTLTPNQSISILQQTPKVINPKLWSLTDPYLYTVNTLILENGKIIDQLRTPYGIRWISWPIGSTNSKQFLLNGKPVFVNGIAEYEHLLGKSHAFTNEQIKSRVMQIKAAGFNAFRDAHQPHNLLYQTYWDKLGILSWTQMAAHIWYDTPAFRKNFKLLLTDWVKERRNSPSVVLWGLENESTLPEDFAKECTEIIRKLDQTASTQRKITTCNGGSGTDWDVPQNWTGTYGGNPQTYGNDLQRQVLVGEYGAWRTLDLHRPDAQLKNANLTENYMTELMETKVRLADSVKDNVAGHFFWLYSSHDNPGRVQGGEGLRDLDRIGPVNYKGMFTPWEEPTDAFYMFRASYAPKQTEPMVYIVSHTWPNRWLSAGIKDSISVYSNCDEVELFNDVNGQSLGKKYNKGVGTHFQWDKVDIKYNVLYAAGYVNGKMVAKDFIVLNNLPQAPNFNALYQNTAINAPQKGLKYVYRLNCGGSDYTDSFGNKWFADRTLSGKDAFGSTSWTNNFKGIPAFFASQRRTFDPITGTADWKLFQSFRYGLDQLKYHFPLPDGDYTVELYFIEPWLGAGGGMDATGMRLFDVAFNGKTVLKDVDVWKAVGHDALLKHSIKTRVKGGKLEISFPEISAGQAIISAIAIASNDVSVKPAPQSKSLIVPTAGIQINDWMDVGDEQFLDLPMQFVALPANLYGAQWVKTSSLGSKLSFKVNTEADVYVAANSNTTWLIDFEDTKTYISNNAGTNFKVYRKRYKKDETVVLIPNSALTNYTVAVLPPSNLEPAYDLKTVTTYKAIDGLLKGEDIVKEDLMGKSRVVFKTTSGSSLEWKIAVGVADVYSLTIKYHNPLQNISKARLEFLSADGVLMKTEKLIFEPTKLGKWNYLTTNTGNMINAGNYLIRLIAEDTKNLAIDAIDVQ